jgi:hypothetical protein
MADDSDWVADVRRWVLANAAVPERVTTAASDGAPDEAIGYEAANPVLQSLHWPAVAGSELGTLR